MARMPSLLELLIWTISVPIASCRFIGLGGDIASLVPTCAQSCLESFITSNYPTVDCGAGFSLSCLCPAQSLSGFTVGEAALQCLLGYAQLGLCDKQDAGGSAPARVLNMCSGQESALPNTHPTLTATLVVPPSGSPILLPPTTTQTTVSTSSTARSTSMTLRTTTRTTQSLTTTTTMLTSASVSTSTSIPVSTTTSAPVSTTNTAPTSSSTSEPSATTRLAPAQVVGISVGVAGAVAIAAGAIFLARFLRPFFQNDNSSGGPDPFGSRGSPIFHISPPVLRTSRYRPDIIPRTAPPAPQATQPEPPIRSPKIDRNTIGLAISRPRSFLPPRPSPKILSSVMSTPPQVEVPLERKPSRLLPPRPALTLDIPSKPVAANRASTFTNLTGFADLDSEADPQSATTLNSHPELDTHTPLTKSPIEKQEEATRMAAAISAAGALPSVPQPAFLSKDPTNRTYSQSSRRRNSFNRINRSDSKASDGPSYENDIARLSQLSPVEESPDPASRRPRVNYPRISGRLDGATIRYVPPPKRPNFTGSPLGQPSPTLGVVYPVEGSPSAYPLPLNPRRKETQFASTQRTGSGFTPEPPNVEVYPINYPRQNDFSNARPYPQTNFIPVPPAEPYRYATDSQQRDPFKTPPQRFIPTFTPSPPSPTSAEKRPTTPPQPGIMDRGRPHIASQRAASGTSFGTVSSTASSLLTKRLGSDRAAALVLDPNAKKAQPWRRKGGGGNGDFLSPDAFSLASPRGTLPQTPIWQPKLTPTRRGDDLFLNVQ
ncbi:hypothetical protein F5Y03DRAFT_385171 [Xylaria venustula]|nr:hypothetical protein F5Y03DRAFT_385171 [Xylaria venustula]